MPDESSRVTRARLRTELRDLDVQIARIRSQDRLFRRYGFGSELHEMQLVALDARRHELIEALVRAGDRSQRSRPGQTGTGSWLLLLPALAALLLRGLLPGRRHAPRLV